MQDLSPISARSWEADTVMLNGMGFKNSGSEVKSDSLTYQLCDLELLFNPWPQFLIREMRINILGVVGKMRLNEMKLKHLGLEHWEVLSFNK